MSARRFEVRDGASSKFWEVEPRGAVLAIRWGKIGTAGQSQEKSFRDVAAATKEMDKLVAEKVKKGYAEVSASAAGAAPASPIQDATPEPAVARAPAKTRAAARPKAPGQRGKAADPPENGALTVRETIEAGVGLTPPVIAHGRLFWAEGGHRGNVLHAHALDGSASWSAPLEAEPATVHVDDHQVVVRARREPEGPTVVSWFDPATGILRGRTELAHSASSVLAHGTVMVLLSEKVLREVDGVIQEVRRAPGNEIVALDGPTDPPRSFRYPDGPLDVAAAGDRLLELDLVPSLVRARRASGEVEWEHPGLRIASDAETVLLVVGRDLVAVDAARGTPRWTQPDVFAKGKWPRGAIGREVVVVADNHTGQVWAFEAVTGGLRWSIALPLRVNGGVTASRPLIGERHALLIDRNDHLIALSLADGSVVAALKESCAQGLWPHGAISPAGDLVVVKDQGDAKALLRLVAFRPDLATPAEASPPRRERPKRAVATLGGLDLASRMRAYVRLFAARGDVRIVESQFGDGNRQVSDDPRLPDDIVAFAERIGSLTLQWSLGGCEGEEGGRGDLEGRFGFRSEHLGRFAAAPWAAHRAVPFAELCTFDDVVPEGNGWLVLAEGGTQAVVGFENSNSDTFTPFPGFEAYVTAGARKAFTWYWQDGDDDGDEQLEALLARSVPRTTPPGELIRLLEARGEDPATARALVEWLGEHVVVLLPA